MLGTVRVIAEPLENTTDTTLPGDSPVKLRFTVVLLAVVLLKFHAKAPLPPTTVSPAVLIQLVPVQVRVTVWDTGAGRLEVVLPPPPQALTTTGKKNVLKARSFIL